MSRTRVKICGVRDADAIEACFNAGADAVGFNFVPESPRFIDPDEAAEFLLVLPPFLTAVGVCRDLSANDFAELEQRCPCPLMQLHGKESDRVVRACGPDIIKAIRFDPATIANQLKKWSALDEVDAILIDGSAGGEGTALDWHALAEHAQACEKPLILAGGLTPDNVAEAIRIVRPWAVDTASGVESSPGVKDPAKIRDFCQAALQA